MHCPFCRTEDTKVIDSRLIADGAQIRRRRECVFCHERFNTFETAELVMPLVIKRDGRRKNFQLEKIRSGMLRALEKRPVSLDALDGALENILQNLRGFGEREVPSRQIGEWVMEALYKLDHIAYIRFASVYKRFADVQDFKQTIDAIKQQDSTIAKD